ncbi:MAG: PfkB family carbohydrate kinase [Candidatus Paceibacterota bacterium]
MNKVHKVKSSKKTKNIKKSNKKALVVGSVVIDTLFDLSSNIKDHINLKDGVLDVQNLMFTAHSKKEYYGGTAANISYGLGLLKQKPILASVVGKDFALNYKKHLKNVGVDLRVHEDKEGFSANFYGMSDLNKEQIGIFLPNVYGEYVENISLSKILSNKDFAQIGIAIFSAGTAKSITSHIVEFKKKVRLSSPAGSANGGQAKKDALTIFDPGQILMSSFDKVMLKKCLENTDILIGNEVEISQINKHFGFSFEEIFKLGVTNIIETQGDKGSIVYTKEGSKKIPAVKVKKSIDPTGAGDAFRSGLIHGLLSGQKIEDAMEIGSVMGALCVQSSGGQAYKISSKNKKS